MRFLKNRTVLGVLCIVLSLIICFAVTPLFNKAMRYMEVGQTRFSVSILPRQRKKPTSLNPTFSVMAPLHGERMPGLTCRARPARARCICITLTKTLRTPS